MINAIQKIGEYIAGKEINQDTFLKNICLKVEHEVTKGKGKNVKQHIVLINFIINDENNDVRINDISGDQYNLFNTYKNRKNKINITTEEINAGGKNTVREYSYVGNASGRSPKIYATSNKFSNVIRSIIVSENDELLNNFFKTKDYKKKKNKKKIYYLNPNFFKYSEKESKKVLELKNKIKKAKNKKKLKKYKKNLLKITEKEILKSLHLSNNNVALYTITLDKKPITNNSEYKKRIFKEKIGKLFSNMLGYKKNYKENSICSICSKKNVKTTSNVTNLDFKFFMNDKLGFSSNLDRKFTKNYNICKNCYQQLMIAERFIGEELKSRIGGLYAYILPKFFHDIDNFNIYEFSRFITFKNQQISDIRNAEDTIKENIEDYNSFNNKYLLNYVFFKKIKSQFKIYKLIKDIPPTRINLIKKREQDIQNLIDEKFGGNNNFYIDFNKIWNCIPIKRKKLKGGGTRLLGTSKYLEVINNIFSNRKIEYSFIINQALETIKIIKFEQPKYNIWNQEDIVNKIINLNFLILFLKKLDILGGFSMTEHKKEHISDDMIPKDIFEYWENLEIYQDAPKKGLFLLGYLIGEIGSKQHSKRIKNKPILNKLNFQGMGVERLHRLSNDVLEKLKQYKILDYNEDIYSSSHLMIEENIENWSLTNRENVFYILSGFSFSNYLMRKRSKDKYTEVLQEKVQLLEKMEKEGKNAKELTNILEDAKQLGTNKYKYSKAIKLLKKIK